MEGTEEGLLWRADGNPPLQHGQLGRGGLGFAHGRHVVLMVQRQPGALQQFAFAGLSWPYPLQSFRITIQADGRPWPFACYDILRSIV